MEEPGGATSLRRANDVAHARASRRARPSRPSRTGERGESARRSSMSCSRRQPFPVTAAAILLSVPPSVRRFSVRCMYYPKISIYKKSLHGPRNFGRTGT